MRRICCDGLSSKGIAQRELSGQLGEECWGGYCNGGHSFTSLVIYRTLMTFC